MAAVERLAALEGLTVLGWRDVPHLAKHCGSGARAVLPHLAQLFVAGAGGETGLALDRRAFCLRKQAERETGAMFRVELVELGLRGVVARQFSGTLHLADDRIKCAVRVVRGTETAKARMRLGGKAFQKRHREPRFPDTSLAREQHHLAFAGLRPGPAPKQQFRFFFPSDKGSHTASV